MVMADEGSCGQHPLRLTPRGLFMIVLGEQLLSSVLITTSLPLRAIDPHDCFEAVRFPRPGADGGRVRECTAGQVHQLR